MDFKSLTQKSAPSLKAKPKPRKAKEEKPVSTWYEKHKDTRKTREGEPGRNIGVGSYKIIGQGCEGCDDVTMHVFNSDTCDIMCLDCGAIHRISNRRKVDTKTVLESMIIKKVNVEHTYHLMNLFI